MQFLGLIELVEQTNPMTNLVIHFLFSMIALITLSFHFSRIIYSITRTNSVNEKIKDLNAHFANPLNTSTTTTKTRTTTAKTETITAATTASETNKLSNNNDTTLAEDGINLKIYVRCKRFMKNKMPKFTSQSPENATRKSPKSVIDGSKNISLVLAALLSNYDYNQRPGFGGSPAVITTNLEIRSMGPISELDMEYSLDCYFRQKWKDERLQFTGNADYLSLNIKMLDKIWKPQTYFPTERSSHLHIITTPNKFLRISKDGLILYSMRLTIKSLCPMDLHSFPMDKQSCPLILGSYVYPDDQLKYVWDKIPVTFNKDNFAMSQFDIIKTISRNSTLAFKQGNHSMLQVNFILRRHVGYFLIQIYVPCSLIVVLSWVSFWINREATADRVGLGVTAVLTLSTFGLDTRNDLPRVSYATALDWYSILCFLFVVFTLLEFASVHYFTKVGTGEVPFIELDEEISESSSNIDDKTEIFSQFSQADKWKRAVHALKRNRLSPQAVSHRNRHRLRPGLRFRRQAESRFQKATEFELHDSSNQNLHKLIFERTKVADPFTSIVNSYHRPYCPYNPDYLQYMTSTDEDKSMPLQDPMNDQTMSYLENYVDQRLRQRSIQVIHPKNSCIRPSAAFLDLDSLRQTSNWHTLASSDIQTSVGSDSAQIPLSTIDLTRDLSPESVAAAATFSNEDDRQSMHSDDSYGTNNSNKNEVINFSKSIFYSILLCGLQFWYCLTSNEKYKKEMKRRRQHGRGLINSVSKIDQVARIVFPLVFFLLNLFYWSFYINERNSELNQWE